MAEPHESTSAPYRPLPTRPRVRSIYTDSTRWLWQRAGTRYLVLTVVLRAVTVVLLPVVWLVETAVVALLLVVLLGFRLLSTLHPTSVQDRADPG